METGCPSAHLGQQRQLAGHGLAGLVGERRRVLAREAMIGELRAARVTLIETNRAIDAVDGEEGQRVGAEELAHPFEVLVGGKQVDLPETAKTLDINAEHAARGQQMSSGPQNSHDEKIMQRDMKLATQIAEGTGQKKILDPEEEARLLRLYREQVLKEPAQPKLVQLGGISNGNHSAAPKQELIGISGD